MQAVHGPELEKYKAARAAIPAALEAQIAQTRANYERWLDAKYAAARGHVDAPGWLTIRHRRKSEVKRYWIGIVDGKPCVDRVSDSYGDDCPQITVFLSRKDARERYEAVRMVRLESDGEAALSVYKTNDPA